MDATTISRIFEETAYIRTGGSPEERKCAEYIQAECAKFGCNAELEPFEVPMSTIKTAKLTIDGKEIPCKGYFFAANGTFEAPLYFLSDTSPYALSQCTGKIVLVGGYINYWLYQDLLENGAVGFITCFGHFAYADRDIDQQELRKYISRGQLLPGVNINIKDAMELVESGATTATIELEQEEYVANSHNVILDLPGEIPEYIVLSAHYDSTSLSQGAYDNMSGTIGLLALAESFATKPHRYGLRFIWCGSEERGLLGAKNYCATHKDELDNIAMDINLDMIGCIMGGLSARCTCEAKMVSYLQYLSFEIGIGCSVSQDIHSSDSTPFADSGVPAVSFARRSAPGTATLHNRYDTKALLSTQNMQEDICFIEHFLDRMANAVRCPVSKQIPDNMKEKLDEYLLRKRPKTN